MLQHLFELFIGVEDKMVEGYRFGGGFGWISIGLVGGEQYLARVLRGRSVIEGQAVRVDVIGNSITLVIAKVMPKGIAIVTDETEIETIPGARLMPHEDHPNEVAALVRSFLERLARDEEPTAVVHAAMA